METHKRLLGISYLVLSTFYIVLSTVLTVLLSFGLLFTSTDESWLMTNIAPVVATILMLVAIPGIICGIGLLYQKGWIAPWVTTIGILFLPFFPLGTLLGLYTLLVFKRFRRDAYRSTW